MLKRLNKPVVSLILAFCVLAGMMSLAFVSAITPSTGVKVGDVVYDDVRVGDTVTYTVNLTAAEAFYGVEAEIAYDSEKLELLPKDEKDALASFKGSQTSMNDNVEGSVKFSASGIRQFDFKTEKPLITLDFVVKDTEYSEISLSVSDIWIDGYGADERWYFKNYEPVITEGITLTQTLEVTDRPEVPTTKESSVPTEEITTQEHTTEAATSAPTKPSTEEETPKKGIGVGGAVYYIADAGDRVVYTVRLRADKLFDGLEATIAYDSEKLEPAAFYENGVLVTDVYEQGRWMCPCLGNPIATTDVDGIIKIYDIVPEGNDFTDSKVLFEIEFIVKDSAYSEIELRIDEMRIKGGEETYFSGGVATNTQGIIMTQELAFGTKPPVVAPEPTQSATDATEPTAQRPTQQPATIPSQKPETQTTEAKQTEASETQPSETKQTEKPDTEKPQTRPSDVIQTESSGESTTAHTSPTSSKPAVVYLIGDANSDQNINVKDATMIQKAVASLVTLDQIQTLAADADQNENLNVKDATAIQKFVAGMQVNFPIGEERTN